MVLARLVLAALALALSLVAAPGALAQQLLTASDGASLHEFGQSVDIDGRTAVVGAPGAEAAYVYTLADGVWSQTAKLTASDGVAGDRFGHAVAVDGDVIAVGAPETASGGAAYLYLRDAGTGGWVQNEQKLPDHYNAQAGARFGHSLALGARKLVVGAPGTDVRGTVDVGEALIYNMDFPTWWMHEFSLGSDSRGETDRFGTSVAMSGDTIVASALRGNWWNDFRGETHVFRPDATLGWVPRGSMIATEGVVGDGYGAAVATDGNSIVTSAPGDASGRGALYVHRLVERGPPEESKLVAGDGSAGDGLGASVAIDGGTILAGAPSVGAVYAFASDGADWSQSARHTTAGDKSLLGRSVAADAGVTFAGAPGAGGTGAAYAFSAGPSSDDAPPETTITKSEPSPSTRTSAAFEFTSSEPGSSFQCSLDGEPWMSCVSPHEVPSWNGAHEMRIRAVDASANPDPTPATATWTTDFSGPEIDTRTPYRSTTSATSITIQGTASDPSGVRDVTWSSSNGTSGVATGTESWSAGPIPLSAGVNRISFESTDDLGNVHEWWHEVTRETTAPRVSIKAPTTASRHATNQPTVSLEGTAVDNGGGVASVTWQTASGASGSATGTSAWKIASVPLHDGANVITVTGTDTSGHSSTDTLTITRETEPPEIAITSPNGGLDYTENTGYVLAQGTVSDEHGIAEVTYTTSNGHKGPVAGWNRDRGTWQFQYMHVVEGPNVITITARDVAGNTSSDTITVTVDTIRPNTWLGSKEPNPTGDRTADFMFTASEMATFECSVDDGPYVACSSPYATPSLGLGWHTVSIRATDAAGNVGGEAWHHWTVIDPPKVVKSPVLTGTKQVGQVLTSSTGTWEGAVDFYRYRWQRCTGNSCTPITGSPDADDGDGTYTLTADDDGRGIMVTVTATNAAGSGRANSPKTVPVGAPVAGAVPVISGVTQSGQVLSSSTGTWSPAATSYAYRWQRCTSTSAGSCTIITGATASTYTVTTAETGKRVRVLVTGTNAAGSATAASALTSVIDVPVNTAAPAISGVRQVGQTLSVTNGGWSPTPAASAYRWQRCLSGTCTDVGGDANTYVPTAADSGHRVRVAVTATNAAGSTTAHAPGVLVP